VTPGGRDCPTERCPAQSHDQGSVSGLTITEEEPLGPRLHPLAKGGTFERADKQQCVWFQAGPKCIKHLLGGLVRLEHENTAIVSQIGCAVSFDTGIQDRTVHTLFRSTHTTKIAIALSCC